MRGLMMDVQLTLPPLLDRAAALYGQRQIVTRRPDRSIHRYTMADFVRRSRQLALALQALGIRRGERVGTLGWNHYQHLEAYFGIPAAGAVLHTLNLRLHPDDLAYIVNHGGDRVILVDRGLLPLLQQIRSRIDVERIVVMSQRADDAAAPEALPDGLLDYEELIAEFAADDWQEPALDERDAAAMCYTSGTTGMPKGVLYSHRSIVLHAMALGLADVCNFHERSVILPVVPMFHVNCWGTPYTAVMVGAKLVFPGPHLDPTSLCELFESERVTDAAGVPTVWLGIQQYLDANPGKHDLGALKRMVVGGAAAPAAMIEAFDRHGIRIVHAWGMTETSPLGTISHIGPDNEHLDVAEQLQLRARQGRMAPLVQVRAVNEQGRVPWDGATMGELEVRGPWIASGYFDSEQGAENFTADGWFRTGDIVSIDADGYVRIEDRAKDLVKSGGEWISSIALENALMGHPDIAEAAIIAVPHPQWLERPLAVVVPVPGKTVTLEQVREYLAPHFASWWLPDALQVVDSIPRTSTGKFKKTELRARFAGPASP